MVSPQLKAVYHRALILQQWANDLPESQQTLLSEALAELQSVLKELQASEAELRHQNEALVNTRQAVESERQRYRELFEYHILRQVINAVKYGAPDTPITLTLQQNETQISLTVHNEGEPIAPDAQSILFQQFRRTTSAEDQTGWGLGLFLAKSIIEAHQGTIEVESAEGKGTSFIIKLPKTSY